MVKLENEIRMLDVSVLVPYGKNNKKHVDTQVTLLAEHIATHGWDVPIVVDEAMSILKGHGRLLAAKKLGLEKVPVIVRHGLTEPQKKALRIADNKLTELAEWDKLNLQDELGSLLTDGVDLSSLGFSAYDLSKLIANDERDKKEDTVPEYVAPMCQLGDVWQLGKHRLMCGDSTNELAVGKLMGDVLADITFTSPPYNAGSLNIKNNETTKKKYNQFDDNQSESEFLLFLTKNVNLCIKHSKTVFYNIGLVENNKRVIIDLQHHFKDKFKDVIYWKKSSVAPHIQPGVINNLVEFILCFGDGKRKFDDAQFKQGSYWNVIEGANAASNEFSSIHKATFPIYLPENIVTNFCPARGRVLDCFMGTGTTLIACEKTGRTCYGMELDPKYCDVIIRRFEDYTGEKAIKVSSLTPEA
jgi:DNA modification methylase